ncbi:MAG: hypothetical protein LBP36_00730 [Oscillospiraceae bacterium]|nr:hypothetical protein [Oscillospiraceae bacterium]
MKYLQQLTDLRSFTKEDVVKIVGNENTASTIIRNYKTKGYIKPVKRNLYVAIGMETRQSVANKFLIASKITDVSYISHHSAFEYYGFSNQVYYETYVSGSKKFASFEFDDITYRYIYSNLDFGVVTNDDGVRVTDLERTILDNIDDFERIGGLEELIKCLELIPSVNEEKLLEYLKKYNKKFLYQKAGYIFQHFQKELSISENFLNKCRKNIGNSKRYLSNETKLQNSEKYLNKEWHLIVLNSLNKGEI